MKNKGGSSAVAVIGMACRFPGANDLRAFWENILAKRRQFRSFPDQRFPLSDYYDPDPSVPDKSYCGKAALVDGFQFDWVAHRIPKSSFVSTDVAHWLALDVALQALADAGFSSNRPASRERSGVILGNTLTGEQSRAEGLRLRWPFVRRVLNAAARDRGLPEQKIAELIPTMESYYKSVFAPVTEDTLAGSLSNTIAGRICNYLDFHGGGYTVDGACSSSLIAVATAATALTNGDLDLALAGGVDVSLDTFELIGFAKTGALTKNDMRVYDHRGSGFSPGEGCGFVALKRLDDAVDDGNTIYAVIRGWGISSDGKGGLTAPSVEGQAIALKRAYRRAGLNPREVDFFEGHGTGTRVGDRVELEAISNVLGEEKKTNSRSCGITSLKSLIGHTKAASGIGGFMKAVIALNRRVLPPTANCTEPNEVFESAARSLYPIMTGEIRVPEEKLKAGISAMGFGGINCHVTIESADAPSPKLAPSLEERKLLVSHQETELFILSGRSSTDLLERTQAVRQRAQGMCEGELVDLAAQLTWELAPGAPLRAALIAGTPEKLHDGLSEIENTLVHTPPRAGERAADPERGIFMGNAVRQCRVGFLFPGQGSQQINSTRTIVERHGWAQDVAAKADRWCGNYNGRKLTDFLYMTLDKIVDRKQIDEYSALLRSTNIAQPAICLCSLLWVEKLSRLGIRPVAAGGHSLGELTGFHAAGAFDEAALLKLAKLRGEAMEAPGDESGIMASLACSHEAVMDILNGVKGYVVVANINSQAQVVISGDRSSVQKAVDIAAEKGIVTHILPVSNAFHSTYVEGAAERLRSSSIVPNILGSTAIKLFSCLSGKLVQQGLKLRDHFADQALSQVDFVSMVKGLTRECDLIIEVGPGKVLSNLANAITGDHGSVCLPVESKAGKDLDLNRILAEYFIGGGEIIWEELYEGRLVRPFIPASERVFIENPCERPFTAPLPQVLQTIPENGGTIESVLKDAANISQKVLSDYIDRRGQFLGAIIKADLEHTAPQAQPMRASQDPHDFSGPAKVTLETKEIQPADKIGDTTASISDMLLELVEKRTGFPRESLSMEFRLLDDLNLDSIKASELIAAVSMQLGVAGNINAAQFANARLSEIADALAHLADNGNGSDQQGDNTLDSPAPNHMSKTWVRNFAVHHVPAPLPLTNTESQDALWHASRVLIMSDESESVLARVLKSELTENGAQVQIVFFSDEPLRLMGKSIEFTHYVTILPRTPNYGISLDARLRAMVERLRTAVILQASAGTPRSNTTLSYIQFGGGYFGGEMQDGDIEQCCTTAFAASVHHERPELKVRVVDFSPNISPAFVSQCLIHELSTPEHYSAAGYDADTVRRVPRPRVKEPASYEKRSITWSSDDVVLVTGGAKGITAECAVAFARATGVRMVLVGSSPHPDDNPERGSESEIARILDRFSSEGLSGRYYCCDITDAESVDRLIRQVRREIGPITGVIHGAGLNRPNRTEMLSSEEALKEIGPKLYGAMNLCKALNEVPPKLFVGFTSIIGVTGMPGNAWYAFSNEALDVLLGKFEKENPMSSVLCIAFSIWEEVGMGARLGSVQVLANRGIGAIPTGEGIQRFLHLLLNNPEVRQVIVAARLGGLDTWNPERHAVPASRFLENIVTIEPNVEVVSRAHLILERDPYIKDHLWRGTYLFPTVFGLEAMSQAVSSVTGKNNFDTLCIENIRLERPIAVFPDNGCTIEIHAEALEKESHGAPQRVNVGIRCEQTGFSEDHFSATFILGKEMEPPVEHIDLPEKPLGIDPKRDLYGGLLFQGPLYQRIQEIYSLNSKQCIFLSELDLDPEAPSKDETNSWLLGDPFFRDSLLHSAQLPLSPDICLPLRIGSIERYPVKQSINPSLIGVAVIGNRVGNEYHATVSALDQNSKVVERITGYVLIIMEHQADYPAPEEFADPGKRDENIIRTELDRRVHQFDVMMPELVSTHMPGIHRASKADRHEQELPFLQETVRRALKRTGYVPEEVRITWLESGKPSFEGAADTGLDISLSHNEGTMLCVSGSGPQGCDIESVTKRSHDEWIALIGKAHESRVQQLIEGNDSPDRAGTRTWVAIESLHKATASIVSDLAIEKQQGDGILFRSDFSNKGMSVLTFPVKLIRGPERMIALVVQPLNNKQSVVHNRHVNVHAERLNFDFESHKVDISTGPQGQPLFIFQFPVTFKETSNPSRTLYFSHYFTWIGKLREFVIQPVYEKLVESFSTGQWSIVTNHAETHIFGEAKSGDIIEGRAWFDRISGKANSTTEMRFEWWKKNPEGKREQIASSTMSTTWVAVRGHGLVEIQPFPDFFKKFLSKTLPSADDHEVRHESSEPRPSFDFGHELYQEPAGPVRPSALLKERILETTLEDANLVGNIYFSNYYLWQGRVRDHYFYEVAPEYFNGSGKQGEFRCIRCKVNHLNEAMPFERLSVRMYRSTVYDRAVRLYFDYYRHEKDGSRKKLGHGEHEAVWYAPNERGEWIPSNIPQAIQNALIPEKVVAKTTFSPLSRSWRNDRYDVIIVGSGIGGLSAGALLAKQGKRVLVLEQHDKPGGFCTSWNRFIRHNGEKHQFIFEAGVNDVATFGERSNTFRILKELGIKDRIEWRRVDHEYIFPDFRIKVPRRMKDYIQLLCELFPTERNGLLAFFKEIEICFEEVYTSQRLTQQKRLHIEKWKSVRFTAMLDVYFRDEMLKQLLSVLTHYFTDKPGTLNAVTAIPCFGYYIEGGFFPVGGTQVLSNALADAIKANGGEVRLRTLVSQILVEDSHVYGVKLGNDEIIHAERVISNADIRKTFLELVGRDQLPSYFWQRIEKIRPSCSAFMVSLAVDFIPDLNPAAFLIDESETRGSEVPSRIDMIMIPSKVDSSLAPPGCACVTLLDLLPHDLAVAWDHNDPTYRIQKEQYGDELIKRVEKAIPKLRDHIIYRQDASPATFARYGRTTDGAIFGLAADEWRPSIKTPIKGLYLAGAGVSDRPGVEDAVYSGRLAADAILKDERNTILKMVDEPQITQILERKFQSPSITSEISDTNRNDQMMSGDIQ